MSRVIICGLGLIGGSIGLALRARGHQVAYVDPAIPLDRARAAGAAETRLDDLATARHDDVVILATPVDVALATLAQLRSTNAVVTTVCSVMAPLRDAAAPIRFVAGHPFAGAETQGLAAARADLFAGRSWFVDRDADVALIESIVTDCGATTVRIDPAEHDRLVALTSHLPQLISTALASVVIEHNVPAEFLGSGLHTLLRLAGSAQSVWQPVIDSNAGNIAAARELFEAALRRAGGGNAAADFARANEFAKRNA